ncbi:MAG: ATP-binding protein [Microcoleus sp. PH2017_10_PVI_O_A]|uniref:ATP-binding protein n=1 Tax=unclassified Microcoleus TaxID=2642155 RepID=UPI001DC7BE3B|nr:MULTISPECIES: ATP-binding protein [unclassified Microcoleus]TAE84430.1 MAG: ATP-binding protein [Oscillatoriales cyanobacterium]MCC3405227.1 ATP-binding protein [Microcoleus sp. PH2017_10_PVI_O_A]MCC3459316.1 ATP-binding protein [Microcoleus sp. PH2017_11_PCY_U_A]MCC3477370.1 ATP-binding protein [Microcoleus sp. PH2017_12_PCY_D_A]MCC3558462.1 ATP-binding protein [Microcoleus sp. PH2017_27_LUM_O_A]
MGRSLRVSPGCIEQVKSAVRRNGFPSQSAFAQEVGLSPSTVKSFLRGNPVDYINFVEISEKLGLDWQTIAYIEQTDSQSPQPNPPQTCDETSPFITGNPITNPRCFFGREKELKRLFNLIKRQPLQNAAIIGKKRSGKTSLLQYLKNITTTPIEKLRPSQKSDWLPHPENYRWIFVDFQDSRLQNREGLLRYILESLKMIVPNPCGLDRFMDVVSYNLHQPTVILLDEIGVGLQRCPELDDGFWESLRSLATNQTNGNLGFVLATPESPIELATSTGHSSPFFNIFGYTTTLGAMTEAEARELIGSSPIPFADEDIEWILTQSKCWPLLLQILCRERLFSLEDGVIGDDWHEEGLEQLKPFAELQSI